MKKIALLLTFQLAIFGFAVESQSNKGTTYDQALIAYNAPAQGTSLKKSKTIGKLKRKINEHRKSGNLNRVRMMAREKPVFVKK